MTCSIRFKIVMPMMFRKPGEFTPFARGPQITATSSPLPIPTTILGAISSCLMDLRGLPYLKIEDTVEWYEEFETAMNLRTEDWFRGPYLLLDHKGMLKIYIQYRDELISLNSLYPAIEGFSQHILKSGLDRKVLRIINDLLERAPILFRDRVGIALDDVVRGVREGFIYMSREVDYSELIRKGDVYIAMDTSKDIKEVHNKVIGLGGERRTVGISVKEPIFIEMIRKELEEWRERRTV